MQLGIIGLGRMGMHMAEKLVKDGHEVIAWNRTKEKVDEFVSHGGKSSESIADLVSKLVSPRLVWSMLPSGEVTDETLTTLLGLVEEGDIVVNGANDRYTNTEKWATKFREKNILFLGIGVSGGLIAAEEGYPMMAGGDKAAYERVVPILDSLAKPHGGHEYFGQGGAGHYVKMVHNAMEYGFMQSIGEGMELLHDGPYKEEMDPLKVAKLWTKGTLVAGFLMDRTVEALEAYPGLDEIEGYIDDTGEGRWAVQVALEHNIPLSVLTEALFKRYRSRQSASFAEKTIAALRNIFGGHKVKTK